MTAPTSFTISIPDEKLKRIRARVEAYQWFPAPEGAPDWAFGMSTPVLKDLHAYWLSDYDWRSQETHLNLGFEMGVLIEV
ncbi:MAG: epoxide hydrolase N-terminal domain-containing protein, partial [Pseudomonadota bacterium]